jgi:transcriptional regulator with XRE-family HTH domain
MFPSEIVKMQMSKDHSRMSERDQEARHGVELGRWVRQRRVSLGMTQEQVTERMEVDVAPNWLTQLEGGRRKALPDTDLLIGLSQALRVSMTDVLRGAGVLPIDMEEAPEQAPGSRVLHALIDMIDWSDPNRGAMTERILRGWVEDDRRASQREARPSDAERALP